MGKRRKANKTMRTEPSLEEQLRELEENAPPGPVMWNMADGLKLDEPSAERREYARKRIALLDAIRDRDRKRLADPGPDASGRFAPSPLHVQHGHIVEDAPKTLKIADRGKVAPHDSAFPKRIATQRMIDRYCAQGIISRRQHRAAERLWKQWRATGLDARMCASYDPDQIRGSASSADERMAGRSDAIAAYLTTVGKVSRAVRPCLQHVVIYDGSAAGWAALRGHSARVSGPIGLAFLTEALDELAVHFGY